MSRIFTDYVNKVAITIPEKFIDVKTGESHPVSQKVQDQIDYHTQNNTLIHFVMSALTHYLHPKKVNGGTEEILYELSEIKRMMQQMPTLTTDAPLFMDQHEQIKVPVDVDIKELEEILDAFGG
ncbi:hypothetical protein JMM81_14470 [Bacillus sp. V3B]|uniref:hypothetical protein n=1 Tax=Bacillus sp. V3B TaxID=2804915 RepID=UPI00210C8E8E|nr:hypothetical protein [Bacillus sp. V3B]MCQ6276129.1 hypothetical protein [Bacillus sp. V3B]